MFSEKPDIIQFKQLKHITYKHYTIYYNCLKYVKGHFLDTSLCYFPVFMLICNKIVGTLDWPRDPDPHVSRHHLLSVEHLSCR